MACELLTPDAGQTFSAGVLYYGSDYPDVGSFRDAAGAIAFELVFLRAIAALSVLVTHALQWPLPEMNMYLLKTGRLGVEVFFVISGFIITTIAGDSPFHPRVFLERRAHKSFPLTGRQPFWLPFWPSHCRPNSEPPCQPSRVC